jgi:hypothetical protein
VIEIMSYTYLYVITAIFKFKRHIF